MEIRNIANLLKSTVSISLFNKGLAGKIFDDVKKNGTKIVIKNNVPECILISPEDYLNLIEKIEDAKLYEMAQERIAQDNGKRYSQKQIMEEFGISEVDLNEEEIEFE